MEEMECGQLHEAQAICVVSFRFPCLFTFSMSPVIASQVTNKTGNVTLRRFLETIVAVEKQ